MPNEAERARIIQQQARIMFWTRVMIGLGVFTVVVFMALTLYSIQVSTAQRNAILSCTIPGGECYKQGEKRTAKAVKLIAEQNAFNAAKTRQIVIYASFCAKQPQNVTEKEVEHCTQELIKSSGALFKTPTEVNDPTQ